MQLILIRHGIAEDMSFGKKDALRNLTSEGVEKFGKEVPGLLALINSHKSGEIWHSPTSRTTQTAEILHKEIPEFHCRNQDFIAENNFYKFLEIIKTINIPDVLIIVGHEPGMSVWSSKISGVNVKFSKGSCAGFKIKDFENLTGKLEFFLLPSALIRLGGK